MQRYYDVVVIGGGPAGMAAACNAFDYGVRHVLIIERERELGGILQQCIHPGFGLHKFGAEYTGPEYAQRYIQAVKHRKIEYWLGATVVNLQANRMMEVISPQGCISLQAGAVILAMGCRERSRGSLQIPGTRPAGVITAGAAQYMVNIQGYLPGYHVVILGSGDIGLIMARRLTLEGAKVHAVLEIRPRSSGLPRNIVQCLDDLSIPLYLSHTIVAINGQCRVESVTCVKVDHTFCPIHGSEFTIACDCVLLAVGLIPENELSRQAGVIIDDKSGGAVVNEQCCTAIPGIFAAGNVVKVHDLVDRVSNQGEHAGEQAARYVLHHGLQKAGA